MKKNNFLNIFLKIIIPSGITIALVWQMLQIVFFTNDWATPGTTSLPLFFAQIISVSVLLYFSFQFYQNQANLSSLSFGRYLQFGATIGIIVAIFGTLLFQFYTNFINPNYETWLQEMYIQSWTSRGLSDSEIQNQLTTNNWLKSTSGMIYSFFFVIGLTTLLSLLPALFVSRLNNEVL